MNIEIGIGVALAMNIELNSRGVNKQIIITILSDEKMKEAGLYTLRR